ncbi:MAG: tryptophanase [Dehalococcoidia bacterium]
MMDPIFNKVRPEPFRIKSVTPIALMSRSERESYIRQMHYNVFKLRADKVFVDLLTDSGTSAMSDAQWAAIMMGDESYASATSWFKLEEVLKDLFGYRYFLPSHQGRGAEKVLFMAMIRSGQTVPNNMHFSPDRVTASGGLMANLIIDEGKRLQSDHPFKGNLDVEKLESLIKEVGPDKIPFVMVTVTCNNAGGQPVSMENMRAVRAVARKYGLPVILDAARIAENAFFIKEREAGYQTKSIPEIVREMCSLSDGCVMSSKKDGLVNIGGFVGINDDALYEQMQSFTLMWEGYSTYGGMAGRDLEALAVGLREVMDPDYLAYRIGQVRDFGECLEREGVPVTTPFGGHGVWLDSQKFCPHIKPEHYPGIAITTALYEVGGVRGCELGNLAFSKRNEETGEVISFPEVDLVRLAVPRRVYTSRHLQYVAEVAAEVFRHREMLGGFKVRRYAAVKYRTVFLGEMMRLDESTP